MHSHRRSPVKRETAQQLIEASVKDGIMSPVHSEWGFPRVLAPKPGNDPPYRLCVDLRKLNEICPKDTYGPPSCDDCLAWLADSPLRTIMDARRSFHQLNLREETRKVLFALVTNFGTYCYNRLVLGCGMGERNDGVPTPHERGDGGCFLAIVIAASFPCR